MSKSATPRGTGMKASECRIGQMIQVNGRRHEVQDVDKFGNIYTHDFTSEDGKSCFFGKNTEVVA